MDDRKPNTMNRTAFKRLLGRNSDPIKANGERIFPEHTQALSKVFKVACDGLGISDLHLHSLRHEGTLRLFKPGY